MTARRTVVIIGIPAGVSGVRIKAKETDAAETIK
jgi:hypothetical protein